jgi:UPF0271 protein
MFDIQIFGDCGVRVQFGKEISETTNERIRSFSAMLEKENIPGIIEWIPAFTAISIVYNPEQLTFNSLCDYLRKMEAQLETSPLPPAEVLTIPVLYGGKHGPDLAHVADHVGLSKEEVIALHAEKDYLIYMMGFSPGFPYLGGMDEKIATPRHKSPRMNVSAGSVGIAGKQTGIYPSESAGGWQIIGKTPVPLYDPKAEEPILLRTGNYIRFTSITEQEFDQITQEVAAGTYAIEKSCKPNKAVIRFPRKAATEEGTIMNKHCVDINSDLGESYGAFIVGQDELMMKYITSANIAAGYHAGDHNVVKEAVQLAVDHKVAIGAHPGYQDLQGFGRRPMELDPEEIYNLVVYQVGAVETFAKIHDQRLQHVKPHGALYNKAALDEERAYAIAQAVYDVNPELILFGLANGELVKAGENIGLRVASEVFADRTYQPDGTLTPRTEANALVRDPEEAAERVIRMVRDGKVEAVDGSEIPIKADTISVHGDTEQALQFVMKLNDGLKKRDIETKRVGSNES